MDNFEDRVDKNSEWFRHDLNRIFDGDSEEPRIPKKLDNLEKALEVLAKKIINQGVN